MSDADPVSTRPVSARAGLPVELAAVDATAFGQAQNSAVVPSSDLVSMFALQVRRRPQEVAVEAATGPLTYEQLDRLSNQLAHRLLTLGVGPESRVGISLPRGAGELVAMLATLKAGGAYVPLDPSNPIERLLNIIEDASPQAMIVHSSSPLAATVGSAIAVVVLDDLAAATEGYEEAAPELSYAPGQLAYILFTSGSTGRPKGVEISRGAFANFLRSMAHTPGLSERDRVLAITTTSFDIAGLELFLPLWVGATVIIVDRETARDPQLLLRRLESEHVSLMQATPATWRLLLEAGYRGDGKLRMLCGGEALSPELAARLLRAGGELWNMYGPTETTVWSSLARITSTHERITIGWPIDQTQIYVLDEALRPVEVGQEGELWIGGAGVARGYHGRPELTAERFVQNPAGPDGDRIYRTGDLGRQLADGRFECLGRLDHQVKIRGFRIELGEIESALRAVPGVDEALVVAEPRDNGDPRLLAYWVGSASRAELSEAAQRRLPAYMLPTAYTRLEIFPLNTNGTIDRKQLPAPEALLHMASVAELPRTDNESRIASIWRDVLGLSAVSADQDFFALGGDSALAVKVVARIGEEIGVEFSLALFFEAPTVRGIAARLDRAYSPDEPIVVWLRKGAPERPPLWCLFGVAIYQELAHTLSLDRSVIGVHVPFRYLQHEERQPTIEELGTRYVQVLREQQPHGPYYLLGLCFGGIVAHEVARQLEAAGQVVGLVTVLDAVLPTGMHADQLVRMRHYLDEARQEPRRLAQRLRGQAKKLLHRVSARSEFDPAHPASYLPTEELPVDGPAIDRAVQDFAAQQTQLASALLIVRASAEPMPPWVQIDGDLGWSRHSARVLTLDIPATHLDILRAPHVQVLAHAISRELEAQTHPSQRPHAG
ncbi:MAG: hypothetical protein JWN48_2251 [Myxococcaceae bacterium]|nr:hypothetical protein [Myxococcaceae bacterium]